MHTVRVAAYKVRVAAYKVRVAAYKVDQYCPPLGERRTIKKKKVASSTARTILVISLKLRTDMMQSSALCFLLKALFCNNCFLHENAPFGSIVVQCT